MSEVRLNSAAESLLAADGVGVLTTIRPDGSPHAAPVRFTWDPQAQVVRVMTAATHRKARNVRADPGGRASICQVEGFRWVTMEGAAELVQDHERIAEGARRYARRYWSPPPPVPGLVMIEIAVDKVMTLG